MIACENLRRPARLIELDPAYCDVIVDRWQRHTDQEAKRDGRSR
jgi:DNA modification methylase